MNTDLSRTDAIKAAVEEAFPSWWNGKGYKMRVLAEGAGRMGGSIITIGTLNTDVARLWVLHGPSVRGERRFVLHWRLRHGTGDDAGNRVVTAEDLRRIFINGSDEDSEAGLFVRIGAFVSIPNRRQSDMDDNNIAVLVDADISSAVERALTAALDH